MAMDTHIQRGLRHLRKSDPILREVIRKAGPFRLNLRHDRFHALALAIVSQQISGKAARSIWEKLKSIADPLSAERIRQLSVDELRLAGLSRQKASYLVDLATRVFEGRLNLNRIGRLSDDARAFGKHVQRQCQSDICRQQQRDGLAVVLPERRQDFQQQPEDR